MFLVRCAQTSVIKRRSLPFLQTVVAEKLCDCSCVSSKGLTCLFIILRGNIKIFLWSFYHSCTTIPIDLQSFSEVNSQIPQIWDCQNKSFQSSTYRMSAQCAVTDIHVLHSCFAAVLTSSQSSLVSSRTYAVCQFLPLVVSLLLGTGRGAPRNQSAGPFILALVLSNIVTWGWLSGGGAGGGQRLVQPPCAPTAPLCCLVDLLSPILTRLWILRAREQLLVSVFAHVNPSTGSRPVPQLFKAPVVLDVIALVLEELNDCVFGEVKLCRQGVDCLLIGVQAHILDEALQYAKGL